MEHNLEGYPYNLVMIPNEDWDIKDIAWFKYKISMQCRKAKDSDCILWLGAYTTAGHGTLTTDSKGVYIHRIIYELVHGKTALDILHKCDIPPCININHLVAGTHLENMKDRDLKGRANVNRGENHPLSRVTKEIVLAIRADNRMHKDIAKDYSISRATVTDIKNRKTWRHL